MSEIIQQTDRTRLFEALCSQTRMLVGFKAVKKNRGSPGIDGVTIEEFGSRLNEELGQLLKELVTWTYEPKPVRRVDIPKPDGKGSRKLGIPCVRDRVVQAALKGLLEPILEPEFSERSYGFRPNRGQWNAVRAAKRMVQEEGKGYVVDIDLEKFFDHVHHNRLIHRLSQYVPDKRILRLIGMILRAGIMENGLVAPSREGTPQGSPLSPLLSNLVLDEMDKELERRGLDFCRFADDCNIFTRSQKAAERVMGSITQFIEGKMKLKVNREKSRIDVAEKIRFLGLTIVKGTIAISQKSINRAMDKVKELTPRGTHQGIERAIERINQWYRGWSQYYAMTQYPSQLIKIEAHIRRRLRSRLVSQQKNRRGLFRLLVQRGLSSGEAFRTAYSNRKRWALSHARAVEAAYPNRWFVKTMGLYIRSDEARSYWVGPKVWIRLT